MTVDESLPRLALTPGEPAGVGPELAVKLAATDVAADLIAVADPDLLQRAAARLRTPLRLAEDDGQPVAHRDPGTLRLLPVALKHPEVPGRLDARNAFYVLRTLARAADGCLAGDFDALVTGPVHKGIINDAGEHFTGHTEYFARHANCDVVMMLLNDHLKVALATTHLPLKEVSATIGTELLERVIRITHGALFDTFGLAAPRLAVLGLNPHAGEGGYLGREEIEVITPVLERLRAEGMHLPGPWPADTAFTPARRAEYDAVLTMYHDQGLPVLKAEAFDRGINITLGLPYIRTSVDHGTALDLAGRNLASVASLEAATAWAVRLATHRRSRRAARP